MQQETIIVGAGPAGLACAAALQQAGLPAIVLEKAANVGASWRSHYDRLHLHTPRRQSGLPGLPMPARFPKYAARDQVVAYLQDYATHTGSRRVSARRPCASQGPTSGWSRHRARRS